MTDLLIIVGSSSVGLLLAWIEYALQPAGSDFLGGESG